VGRILASNTRACRGSAFNAGKGCFYKWVSVCRLELSVSFRIQVSSKFFFFFFNFPYFCCIKISLLLAFIYLFLNNIVQKKTNTL
jgi:hypothetical protein